MESRQFISFANQGDLDIDFGAIDAVKISTSCKVNTVKLTSNGLVGTVKLMVPVPSEKSYETIKGKNIEKLFFPFYSAQTVPVFRDIRTTEKLQVEASSFAKHNGNFVQLFDCNTTSVSSLCRPEITESSDCLEGKVN